MTAPDLNDPWKSFYRYGHPYNHMGQEPRPPFMNPNHCYPTPPQPNYHDYMHNFWPCRPPMYQNPVSTYGDFQPPGNFNTSSGSNRLHQLLSLPPAEAWNAGGRDFMKEPPNAPAFLNTRKAFSDCSIVAPFGPSPIDDNIFALVPLGRTRNLSGNLLYHLINDQQALDHRSYPMPRSMEQVPPPNFDQMSSFPLDPSGYYSKSYYETFNHVSHPINKHPMPMNNLSANSNHYLINNHMGKATNSPHNRRRQNRNSNPGTPIKPGQLDPLFCPYPRSSNQEKKKDPILGGNRNHPGPIFPPISVSVTDSTMSPSYSMANSSSILAPNLNAFQGRNSANGSNNVKCMQIIQEPRTSTRSTEIIQNTSNFPVSKGPSFRGNHSQGYSAQLKHIYSSPPTTSLDQRCVSLPNCSTLTSHGTWRSIPAQVNKTTKPVIDQNHFPKEGLEQNLYIAGNKLVSLPWNTVHKSIQVPAPGLCSPPLTPPSTFGESQTSSGTCVPPANQTSTNISQSTEVAIRSNKISFNQPSINVSIPLEKTSLSIPKQNSNNNKRNPSKNIRGRPRKSGVSPRTKYGEDNASEISASSKLKDLLGQDSPNHTKRKNRQKTPGRGRQKIIRVIRRTALANSDIMTVSHNAALNLLPKIPKKVEQKKAQGESSEDPKSNNGGLSTPDVQHISNDKDSTADPSSN